MSSSKVLRVLAIFISTLLDLGCSLSITIVFLGRDDPTVPTKFFGSYSSIKASDFSFKEGFYFIDPCDKFLVDILIFLPLCSDIVCLFNASGRGRPVSGLRYLSLI